MADRTQQSDAGIAGTGEDATSKTPLDQGRNVGAGRAGGAGTVADDGSRVEGRAGEDLSARRGDTDTDTSRDEGDKPTPILSSDTIGVGAGNASTSRPDPTDVPRASEPPGVYGTGDRPAGGTSGADDNSRKGAS